MTGLPIAKAPLHSCSFVKVYLVLMLIFSASNALGRVYIVDNGNSAASDNNTGSASKPLLTINAAAAIAEPGDTVLVHKGTYRERIVPQNSGTKRKPITYRAIEPGSVIVKGSVIYRGSWQLISGLGYKTSIESMEFPEGNPFHQAVRTGFLNRTGLGVKNIYESKEVTLGQIHVNGKKYSQEGATETRSGAPGSWKLSPDGKSLIVQFKPADIPSRNPIVEVVVRSSVFAPFRRGLEHIHVDGFIMEHAAAQGPFPQTGLFSIRSGKHWRIENNIIRHSSTVGLDIGSEHWDVEALGELIPTHTDDLKIIYATGNVVENNDITDNGLSGIAGWNVRDTAILGNLVSRNNSFRQLRDGEWEEWAGIKMHASNTHIEGNKVVDNNAHGIWLDAGYSGSRITRNTILNNVMTGVMVELGFGKPGVLIDHNTIANTRWYSDFHNGSAISAHDASDVTVQNNLFVNNEGYGVNFRVATDRVFKGKLSEASSLLVTNNIFSRNKAGELKLPKFGSRGKDNYSDYNYFESNNINYFQLRNRCWQTGWIKLRPRKKCDQNSVFAEKNNDRVKISSSADKFSISLPNVVRQMRPPSPFPRYVGPIDHR